MKICVVTQQVGKVYSGPGVHSNNLIRSLVMRVRRKGE